MIVLFFNDFRFILKLLLKKRGGMLNTNGAILAELGYLRPRKMAMILMAIFCSISVSLHPLSTVFATSAWDNALATTNTLKVEYTGTGPIDITDNFLSIMHSSCPTQYASLISAAASSNGRIIVVQAHGDPDMDPDRKHVNIGWTTDTNKNISFEAWANSVWAYVDQTVQLYVLSDGIVRCMGSSSDSLILSPWTSIPTEFVYSSTYPVVYPSGYSGVYLSAVDDIDADSLNATAESLQGTSDYNVDTDGDGLRDNIESENYSGRNAMFCNTAMTPPYTCAYPEPLVKDLYVEVDWMDDGTNSYKPSGTQLDMVKDGLDDNGYRVHIDAGQFGGGNELPTYIESLPMLHTADPVGFFDLKNGNTSHSVSANFNSNRQGVWRYLISGYGYAEHPGSSGAAYAGSDNVFISYGTVQDDPVGFDYTDFDTAIAGTMVHEIGHSLCMSDTQSYTYQSSNCVYSGVDNEVSTMYDSSLNYSLQMLQYKLSDGGNLWGDHDDWGAIDSQGIADFAAWETSDIVSSGVTAAQVQEMIKKGVYGRVVRGDKVYDLRHGKVYDSKENKVYTINKDREKIGLSNEQDKWRGQLSRLLK